MIFRIILIEILLPRMGYRKIRIVFGEVALIVVFVFVSLIVIVGLESRRAATIIVGEGVFYIPVVFTILVNVLIAVGIGITALNVIALFRVCVVVELLPKVIRVPWFFTIEVVMEWFLR